METFTIFYNPIVSTLTHGNARVVDKLLSIPDPAAGNDSSVTLQLWDGLIHFFDRENNTFPSGLLPRLMKRLTNRGYAVNVVHEFPNKEVPPVTEDFCHGVTMRDYQVEAVNLGLQHRRGLWWMATNAGKSVCIAAAVGQVVRTLKCKGVIIVPSVYLLHQTTDDVKHFLPDLKVGMTGSDTGTNVDILVGTYQALARGARSRGPGTDTKLHQFMKNCGIVLCDEAHHIASRSIQNIYATCEQATFRLGCSGTVEKYDHAVQRENDNGAREHLWRLESVTGPVLYRVDNQYLIENGYSAVPRVYVVTDRRAYGPNVITPMVVPGGPSPYLPVFKRAVIEDTRFHATVAQLATTLAAAGKPTFVFSHSVVHIKALSNYMDSQDIRHAVTSGTDPMIRRKQIIEEFSTGKHNIVVASGAYNEGMSIPGIRCAILAGARKTPVELLQRIGRAVRRKDDDNTCIIIDFNMSSSTLLSKHFNSRLAAYKSEGFDVRYITNINDIPKMVW